MNNIKIIRSKREDYIKAWNHMYNSAKKKFNDPIYDGVNPSLNKKPLNSEIDNYCTIAYDTSIDCKEDGFEYGKPVGIFCFVITPSKTIGKQYIVHPDYMRKGIGKALLLENEKTLIENHINSYYIGCSHCSAGIMESFGRIPYNSDEKHDMYKFIVENLGNENWYNLYNSFVIEKEFI